MAITLTKYIYPIKEPIVLSKTLGYTIDNPRTKEEIQFIKDYISPALIKHFESSKPHYNPMLSAAFAISQLTDFIKDKDEYVYSYLTENNRKEVDDIISECWIVIRYSDAGEFDRAKEKRDTLFDILFTESKKLYWANYNTLLSYFHLLSLLIHDEEEMYEGDSLVLLKRPHDIFYPQENIHPVIQAFQRFHGNGGIGENRGLTWNYFPDVIHKLISASRSIEYTLTLNIAPDKEKSKNKKQTLKDKLLFVGDLLRVVGNETQDVNVKLLLLVSIVESLVTRNPDTTKFNVEDSISKQFVLKTTILIYSFNNEMNLEETKNRLKLIYNQRSDVAHANYISEAEREKIIESFFKLYEYIRAIISLFLKDALFIEFLKES